jgi:hypothetical protein
MPSKAKYAIALAAGVGSAVLGTWVHAELPELRIVTATGVALPDAGELEAEQFSTAIDGDTAFLATELGTDRVMLVREIDKRPHVVLRYGDPSPNGDGTIIEFGAFEMSPAGLLFRVLTSNGDTLLLTHDESGISTVYESTNERFELEATNARGDALLRDQDGSLTLVPSDADAIVVARNGDPIPSVPGSVFDLSNFAPAYLADDGQVVFSSAYAGGAVPGNGVFFMPGDATTIEQVMVSLPGEPTAFDFCCRLEGAADSGIVAITGYREADADFLFMGKPPDVSLVLTVPFGGTIVPGAPEFMLEDLAMYEVAVGRGGDSGWISGLGLVMFEADAELRVASLAALASETGGPLSIENLITDSRGGYQFNFGYHTVYRTAASDEGVVIERLAGPTDTFEGPGGSTVTAQRVISHLDARAFEAGRVALTIEYSNPKTGANSEMTVVDGTPPPPLPDSCHCR